MILVVDYFRLYSRGTKWLFLCVVLRPPREYITHIYLEHTRLCIFCADVVYFTILIHVEDKTYLPRPKINVAESYDT